MLELSDRRCDFMELCSSQFRYPHPDILNCGLLLYLYFKYVRKAKMMKHYCSVIDS